MQEVIDRVTIPINEGIDKTATLSEAVKRFVGPGMTICFGGSYAFPSAACYEIVRQFRGKEPGFTFASTSFISVNGAILVHGGLVKKFITGFTGDTLPSPAPNPIFRKAVLEEKIEVEHWSILTFTLRLAAGAMDLPFLPTYSLLDTDIGEDNIKRGVFTRIDDPFTGKEIGLVRSLNPDITFLHTTASDRCGNGLLSPPYVTNIYSSLSAKKGVIMTTERIVPTELIRKNASLVKIPSENVIAVCEVPFGCHPTGLLPVIPEVEGYSEDQEFVIGAREACKSPDTFSEWIKKWVLSPETQEDYVSLLGDKKILYLKARLAQDSWLPELLSMKTEEGEPTPQERIISVGIRILAEKAIQKGYKIMLCGIGAAHLATWLAYYELLKRDVFVDIMAEIGLYGYAPRPCDPYIFATRNISTSKMYADVFTMMGTMLRKSLGVLGAGQVDKYGNINSTVIPQKDMYLVGSGGANDVASVAREVVVLVEQNSFRFVEKVPYITSSGKRVSSVVSQYGVFEKEGGELVLKGYYSDVGRERSIELVKKNCGWKPGISDQLKEIPPPMDEELKMIRAFDPKKYFR